MRSILLLGNCSLSDKLLKHVITVRKHGIHG